MEEELKAPKMFIVHTLTKENRSFQVEEQNSIKDETIAKLVSDLAKLVWDPSPKIGEPTRGCCREAWTHATGADSLLDKITQAHKLKPMPD